MDIKTVSVSQYTVTFENDGTIALSESNSGADEYSSNNYREALAKFAGEVVRLRVLIEHTQRAGIMIAEKVKP